MRRTLPANANVAPEKRGARKDWSENMGSGATVGALNYPAKYTFTTATASCSDYVAFNTGVSGSSGVQPTIVAYTNLYSGCGGSVPTVYWQYNTAYPQGSSTGDGSFVPNSVVLSADGSQVAFVQNSSGVGELVVLRWSSNPSQVEMDSSANNVAPANYPSCGAPCMTLIPLAFSDTAFVTSPFYDYADDVMYVADDDGYLHQFTGVFLGTPAEVTSAPWPVLVDGAGNQLYSPVYGSGQGSVYLLDSNGVLDAVNVSTGAVTTSATIGFEEGLEYDAPLVDSVAGAVYAFVPLNAANERTAVVQFPYNFPSGSAGTEAKTNAINFMFLGDGAFDNAYFTSATPGSPTGNLYLCCLD